MEGDDPHLHDPRGQNANEDAARSRGPVYANEPIATPSSPGESIRQRNLPLSLLLSPPSTSPLFPLNGNNSSPQQYLHRQYNGSRLPLHATGLQDTTYSHTNGSQPLHDSNTGARFRSEADLENPFRERRERSQPIYDSNRGTQLRREAELANPFRERRERPNSTYEQGRARSRSPRRMIQHVDTGGYRERPRDPWMGLPAPKNFPRETYVPPGPNDMLPQRLPSSSSTLSPDCTPRGRDHRPSHPEDSFRELYPTKDHNPYGHRRNQRPKRVPETSGERHPATETKKDINNADEDHLCEFAAPCRMNPSPDGMHYRKVVSHVFGRNKAVTKLFPVGVWVHYCRKHYQRARYRADQWPFTQCDLLLESLRRMEIWNGVESFELILRRREQVRVRRESEVGTASNESKNTTSTNQSQVQGSKTQLVVVRPPGRKHPTAITAPVPDWLRQYVGHGKTFADIREIIERVRSYMTRLRNSEVAQQLKNAPQPPDTLEPPRRAAASNCKKGRPAKPANRDPINIRGSKVRFPDIEILPRFKPWVKEAALRQRSAAASSLQENNQRDSGKSLSRAHTMRETWDFRTVSARAFSRPSINEGHADNELTLYPQDRHSELSSTSDTPVATGSEIQAHIGRAGTNRGQSESQRRRSERVYMKALDRVSRQGSVKKPGDESET
ncbi:hypothetical protein N7457_005929 [Penicillium paradoxum]|uniref:uncharacterized protein n=1 Tax=Penicillium paradoxum TaxID=176176 RepID=UPI0025480EC0|nr:uncharacterized protein N7457_005929 [Penicillium paradoxum]KAJ5780769.1 hypothetical protein N7457_005929 [Penicillium paradoxum]